MRILVTGGRNFVDRNRLFNKLDEIDLDINYRNNLIIHGACRTGSADKLAEEWTQHREIAYVGVPAKWTAHGRAAGPMRNQRMIDEWRPDLCVCFPGGIGTADMVRRCKAAGIEVIDG